MQRWIGWFALALCAVAHSQKTDDDAEQKILGALRSFNKAQVLYRIYGKGFACRLDQLGPPRNGGEPSAEAAGLIDENLASGQFAGYRIELTCTADDFAVTAIPVSNGVGPVWCVDKSFVLRTAISAGTCISEGKVPPRSKRAVPVQFSNTDPNVAQDTQARGYWLDPSTKLMWTAKDSEKRMGWHNAVKYCRALKTAGYSDWSLPSIDDLESLVNLSAYATEYVGSSDIVHWNGDLRVNGGLLLAGDRHWSGTPVSDPNQQVSKTHFWSFDYRVGRRRRGFEDWAEGDTMYALCVRRAQPSQTQKAPLIPASPIGPVK